MPRSRKNKLRQHPKGSGKSSAWLLFALPITLAFFVIFLAVTESIHLPLAAYGAFALSIFFGWYAIRTGAFYSYGSPTYRSEEPEKFWIVFTITIVPLFLLSGYLIAIHVWSMLGH